MSDKIVHIKEIGNIHFVKNHRAKNLRITVSPTNGVKVTVPFYVSLSNAYQFVEEKREWIKKSLVKFESTGSVNTIFRPGIPFRTRDHHVEYIHDAETALKVKVTQGIIKIIYSSEEVLSSTQAQSLIRQAIDYALRLEAKHYLPVRVNALAQKHGFTYASVKVKNMKSRWGSCSYTNAINLNIHLMRLPDYLIDYVILHELVHTVHKNHAKGFWEALDQVSGNARLLAREMKKYRTTVY